MNTTFDVLVIALSALLAIFLVLSIVTLILVLRLVASLRTIVAKGEHLVDSAEAIGETFRRNAGAVSVVRVLMHVINTMNRTRHRKD